MDSMGSQYLPEEFKPAYTGMIQKQGHFYRNWKHRYFVIKGCVVMYFTSELVVKEMTEKPKGIHIITEVKDWPEEPFGWIMNTLDKKVFNLKTATLKQKKEAVGAMKEAIRVFQSNLKLEQGLHPKIVVSIALAQVGNVEYGIAVLKEYLNQNPNDVDGHFQLGTSYLVNGEEMLGIEQLKKCLQLNPSYVDASINLAMGHYLSANLEEARRILDPVVDANPTNVEAANNLALIYVQLNTSEGLEKAEKYLSYALQCNPSHVNTALLYADLQIMIHGNNVNALETLQNCLSENNRNASLLLRFGQLLYEDGVLTESIEYFQDAVDCDPTNMEAITWLQAALERCRNDSMVEDDASSDDADSAVGKGKRVTLNANLRPDIPSLADVYNSSSSAAADDDGDDTDNGYGTSGSLKPFDGGNAAAGSRKTSFQNIFFRNANLYSSKDSIDSEPTLTPPVAKGNSSSSTNSPKFEIPSSSAPPQKAVAPKRRTMF